MTRLRRHTGNVPAIAGISRTVLVAPDSFKGTMSASQVGKEIGKGLAAGGMEVDLCPAADGGEGTLEALRRPMAAERREAQVTDPLGRPIEARFAIADRAAIVETAAATGLGLVAPRERDAIAASSAGTGELIVEAVRAGAKTVYLGVGGSASTDGGRGAIGAIEHGGGLAGARIVVLCDVRTPFEDAARMFGPQKGAGPDEVRRLSARLAALAKGFDRDPRGVPMTGAAGGLAGGLWATFGADLVPGASFILDAVDFDRRMRAAHAVITGEGKLDQQSLVGKVVSEVATRARQAGVPCFAVVGKRDLGSFELRILDLQAVLEARDPKALRAAGRKLTEMI
jgi:glycerate kinase